MLVASLYATQSVGDFVNLLIGIAEEWLHLGLGEGKNGRGG